MTSYDPTACEQKLEEAGVAVGPDAEIIRDTTASIAAAGDSIERQCARLGEILGLAEPVEERILAAALANPSYATNLLVCRGSPELLEQLLANPPTKPGADIALSTLLQRGAEALVRWGKAGFTTVGTDILKRRLEACDACPHLSTPPQNRKILYRLAGTAAGAKSVCRVCACPVTRKAAMTSEACPDADPDNPAMTRWGEPLKA